MIAFRVFRSDSEVCLAGVLCVTIACLTMSCHPRIIRSEECVINGPIQNFYRDKWGERNDAVELDSRYKAVFANIDDEVNQTLKDDKGRGRIGFIHTFWFTKQRILLHKYGIHWRSPRDLNPNSSYD